VSIEVLRVSALNINLKNLYTLIPAKEHDVLERFQLIIVDDQKVIFEL